MFPPFLGGPVMCRNVAGVVAGLRELRRRRLRGAEHYRRPGFPSLLHARLYLVVPPIASFRSPRSHSRSPLRFPCWTSCPGSARSSDGAGSDDGGGEGGANAAASAETIADRAARTSGPSAVATRA